MKDQMILAILRTVYCQANLHDALKEYVEKTDNEWDDRVLNIFDLLLGCDK